MKNLFLAIVFLLLSTILNATEMEKVSIQLKWKHGFQFAGYYAAVEKGFYADEGLDVSLKEIDLNHDYIKDVANGKNEYGVSDSSLVVYHLKQTPVVLVSQIFQHSPLILISHRDSNITSPYELIGKKLMFSIFSSGATPFKALILKTIVDFSKVKISNFTTYQDFIDRKVDVTSAYSTSQPYWLKEQGVEINIIDPKSYGIDFYGDNFFTSKQELQNHPKRVEKMRKATLKGWEYALSHQDEIINLILKKYDSNKTKGALEFEARGTYQMIMPDLTALGSFSKEKYNQVTKTYYQLGIVNNDKIEDNFYYENRQKQINLTPEEKLWLEKNEMIKLAVMNYWESDNNQNNIHIDLIKLLNKYGDINIVPVKFNIWKDGFSEASKGENIHGILNISYSKQREKNFLFTKAYGFTPNYLIVKNDNNDIKSLEDLKNKTIYLKEKVIANELIKDLSDDIKIINLETDEEIYKKLSTNINVVATVSYTIDKDKLKKYNLKVARVSYGKYGKIHIGISHKHPQLRSIINKIYETIPKGELAILQNKNYEKDKHKTIHITKKERKWLNQNPTITFAGDPNWLPFEAFDKNGNYIGIVSDYLKKLENLLTLEFKPHKTHTWLETLELAKKGSVDVISDSVDSQIVKESYQAITPYIHTPIVIVMRDTHSFVNDISDISDKKIALISGYGYVNSIKKHYPKQKFVTVENADKALEKLSDGKIDAAIMALPKAGYLIRSKGYSNLKIVGKTSVELHLTLFVLKSKPLLHTILEKAMQSISKPQQSNIIKEWMNVEFAEKTNYKLLFQIAGILVFFLLGAMYWNRKLSKEIYERKKIQIQLDEAREKAEVANLTKSEFLANMSHEIRTPMNSVMGFSELLAKQITDPIQKDYLDSIQRGGSTLLNIINDILDLSKIEAGKLDMVLESVDIKQLALEMESIFSIKLIQKNIHFDLDIDPSLPKYLLLDNTRVRQILFNLIGNAIKFTHHGVVKLSIKKSLENEEKSKIDLQIMVEDTGIGIDKENLKQIFNAFEQQPRQNQKYGGTGLGLAISKKLTHMMGGTILVESKLNVGSKFTINLPNISVTSIETNNKKEMILNNIKFKKATVLVVDDIKDNRKLVTSILNEYGLETVEAENGQEAIESLKNIRIDLILMDIKMPIMDGYEATKIIKDNKNLKLIPLIALTASVMGKDLEKIKEYQFDGYLRKPILENDLITKIGLFLPYENFDNREKSSVETNNCTNLPKIIKALESDYLKTWEKIKDMGDFTLIAKFANSLEKLGQDNDINTLSDYAKELKINCESFDIDKIDFLMNSYPQLIKKFQGQIN